MKREMPPVHPGEILKEMYLDPLGIGVSGFSAILGVGRRTISLIVNGRSGVSAEMALRLAKALNTTPELWLNMQRDHDLWNAGKKIELKGIKTVVKAA